MQSMDFVHLLDTILLGYKLRWPAYCGLYASYSDSRRLIAPTSSFRRLQCLRRVLISRQPTILQSLLGGPGCGTENDNNLYPFPLIVSVRPAEPGKRIEFQWMNLSAQGTGKT